MNANQQNVDLTLPHIGPRALLRAYREARIAFCHAQIDVYLHGAASPDRAELERTFLDARTRLAALYYRIVRLVLEARQRPGTEEFHTPDLDLTAITMLPLRDRRAGLNGLATSDMEHLSPDEVLITPLTWVAQKFATALTVAHSMIESERVLYNPEGATSGDGHRSVYYNTIRGLAALGPNDNIRNAGDRQIATPVLQKYHLFCRRINAEPGLGFRNEKELDLYPHSSVVCAKMNEVAAATGIEDIIWAVLIDPLDTISPANLLSQRTKLQQRARRIHRAIFSASSSEDAAWNKLMKDATRTSVLM
ncbi:hypothetical protein B0T14DRAFT_565212 [Immersiella caudata]|uniref:Uncharacterized protein n=1 Tax=Immersiella caudata TaxID=314043 RepID=A0AA39WYG3_9PEZI|nr:hypothetical protein B0T14DRAFT_565212 [Immersiella caudata]